MDEIFRHFDESRAYPRNDADAARESATDAANDDAEKTTQKRKRRDAARVDGARDPGPGRGRGARTNA